VSAAQELASINDKVVRKVIKIAGEQHLSMREVRTIAKYYRKTSQQGELSSFFDLGANYPDPWERRTSRIDRALARAVASLKMDKYRLNDVIYDVEDEGDEWVVSQGDPLPVHERPERAD